MAQLQDIVVASRCVEVRAKFGRDKLPCSSNITRNISPSELVLGQARNQPLVNM
jgi:hypothetical protein